MSVVLPTFYKKKKIKKKIEKKKKTRKIPSKYLLGSSFRLIKNVLKLGGFPVNFKKVSRPLLFRANAPK